MQSFVNLINVVRSPVSVLVSFNAEQVIAEFEVVWVSVSPGLVSASWSIPLSCKWNVVVVNSLGWPES